MTAWPSTFPQRLSSKDFSDALPNNVLATQMDVGAPKLRKRTSATVEPLKGSMIFTDAQWEDLKTFYQDTIDETLPFDFPDPSNLASTVSVTFVTPPSRVYNGPGTWRVTLSFNIQP